MQNTCKVGTYRYILLYGLYFVVGCSVQTDVVTIPPVEENRHGPILGMLKFLQGCEGTNDPCTQIKP